MCDKTVVAEPSQFTGQAPCPNCGQVLWFHKRTADGVVIIDAISGKVALSQEIEGVSSVVIREQDIPQVVVNLADVQLVTSSFIAGLVALHKRIRAASGKMVVCGLSTVVRETLHGAKLDKLLNIADTEQQALACF
jgi:anti-anti-sigma factor